MSPIEREVLDLVRIMSGGREASRASTWEELGFDSLDVTELLMEAEERFGARIPDDLAATLRTVGDVIAHLERRPVGA